GQAGDALRRIEDRPGRGEDVADRLPHPDRLRALAREHETKARGGPGHHPHRHKAAPQVSPVLNAANSSVSPLDTSPLRTASSRGIGIDAAEVLPTRSMLT